MLDALELELDEHFAFPAVTNLKAIIYILWGSIFGTNAYNEDEDEDEEDGDPDAYNLYSGYHLEYQFTSDADRYIYEQTYYIYK